MPVSQLLAEEQLFATVPDDWHVIVTDIKQSTRAYGRGLHQEINLIATGSIICILNLAHRARIRIPFFFGGDGATLLVPEELLAQSLASLHKHRANSLANFQLDLRVGAVSVSDLIRHNQALRISHIYLNEMYAIPVILGDGLAYAERQVKANHDAALPNPEPDQVELDLSGMECRWDKIRPAQEHPEIVCLIVHATDQAQQAAVYKEIIDTIDSAYGPFGSRSPVTPRHLHLDTRVSKIVTEMRAKKGRMDLPYLAKNWLGTMVGKWWYFKQNNGRAYKHALMQMTDTLVLDGRINTVMAGTRAQRAILTTQLDRMEQANRITYGLFVSPESVMSCYVQDRVDKHIHFVDGSEGGYTMAARMLKDKLRG